MYKLIHRIFNIFNISKFQNFMRKNMIMNWSNLQKCILILVLACVAHLLWIIWKVFILMNPEYWPWMNIPVLKSQLLLNVYFFFILAGLILPCYFLQGRKKSERCLPALVVSVFTFAFFRDAYIIGLFSPATITGYICLSGIGLLLFERKIVYPPLFFSTLTYFILGYFTIHAQLPYAPLFSQNLMFHYPFNSEFWVQSMLYFILPILTVSFVLCEILLTQWREREAFIKKLSQIDPLTNLYNRRSFSEQLRHIHTTQQQYAIIILDLDHFKSINDRYGHSVGDEALRCVAKALKNNVREQDIVARFGGEEFIILLQETSQHKCIDIAERCRQAIRRLDIQIEQDISIQFTASFGIATSKVEYEIEQVVRHADQALYKAKQQGRDQIQCFSTMQTA